MTDKARKRRKGLAAKLNVSRSTAANIISTKRDKSRRATPEPMQRDVLARTLGGSPPDAHYVYLKYDPRKGQTFGDAVMEARKEAVERDDLLEVSIRRVDYPGHPFICSWSRRAQGEPWVFCWQSGAEDRAAQPLVTVRRKEPATTFPRGDERASVHGYAQDARAVGGACHGIRANGSAGQSLLRESRDSCEDVCMVAVAAS
jgi:hypothetical protein